MRTSTLLLIGTLALASVLSFTPAREPRTLPAEPVTFVVVRHAEKQTDREDPGLTPEGDARARRIASMIRSLKIGAVYSTDFARTRQTAAPIARRAGVEVRLYDARNPVELADPPPDVGCVVIVGHSNTVPDLVRRLGGQVEAPKLSEAT
ncbi:MAG: SixA phosphatase family protein [Phycisphaerales bacterium JB059]